MEPDEKAFQRVETAKWRKQLRLGTLALWSSVLCASPWGVTSLPSNAKRLGGCTKQIRRCFDGQTHKPRILQEIYSKGSYSEQSFSTLRNSASNAVWAGATYSCANRVLLQAYFMRAPIHRL